MATFRQRRPPRRFSNVNAVAATMAMALTFAAVPLTAAHNFPYVPTQLLSPFACFNQSACRGRDLAYVFTPTGDGPDEVQLLAFNVSADLSSASRPHAISPELPFLRNAGPSTAFGAVRTANGTIMVHTGACDGDAAHVWSFDPGDEADDDSGTAAATSAWIERPTTRARSAPGIEQSPKGPQSPSFLGATLAFSLNPAPPMDQPTIYTYGGMCAPVRPASYGWQSNANYSKAMTSLVPDSPQLNSGYSVGVASMAGPRAPFAGFSLTPLPPSISNTSGTLSQQASFVFLGGHTQTAFINMSTAAVWSLPEESWSYVNIQPPPPGPDSHLAKPSWPDMDSRSGHTAVLSEDGKSVAVLGGWVGDVATAAEPQLAVLEMNQTYSSWRWTIPAQQPAGGGIYGHGAAMLPGNVMMVYGGWRTRQPKAQPGSQPDFEHGSQTETKAEARARAMAKRQEVAVSSPRFFNLTSMTWTSTYRNPAAGNSAVPGAPDAQGSSPTSRRLGLGLGLGMGVAAVVGLVVLFSVWRRRRRRHRAALDEALRSSTEDAKLFLDDDGVMAERERDAFSWGRRDWRAGAPDPYRPQYLASSALAFEELRRGGAGDGGRSGAIRSGGGGGLPYPDHSSIVRKPLPRGQRSGYLPAESRFSAFVSPPGIIHPILEDDEDEDLGDANRRNLNGARQTSEGPATPSADAALADPFASPTSMAPPAVFPAPSPSPSSMASPDQSPRHDPDVQDWVSDVDANDGLLARYGGHHLNHRQGGRMSPTRRNSNRSAGAWDDDSRTGSNMSESNRSAATADSGRRTPSGKRLALLTGLGTAPAIFAAGGSSSGGNGGDQKQQKPDSSSSSSYNTARSGFGALQAEAPSLLPGPGGSSGGGRVTPVGSPGGWAHEDEEPGSPSKSKPPALARRGWLGSLRRVFSVSSSSSPVSARTAGGGPSGGGGGSLGHDDEAWPRRRASLERTASDYEPPPHLVGLGGELLRRKQGRHDWEEAGDVSAGGSATEHRHDFDKQQQQQQPHRQAEGDWDVERAAEQRMVQVMFTVPRERLRVVNADEQMPPDEAPAQAQVAELVDPDAASSSAADTGPSPGPSPVRRLRGDEVRSEDVDEDGDGDKERGEHADKELLSSPPPPVPPRSNNRDNQTRIHPDDQDRDDDDDNADQQHLDDQDHPDHHAHLHRQHRVHDSLSLQDIQHRRQEQLRKQEERRHQRQRSHSTDGGRVLTAEAVTLARPRTRVLRMVETLESLSQTGSTSGGSSRGGSPVRAGRGRGE